MPTPPPDRKRAIMLSNILFALVLIASLVVGYLYFFDNRFFNDGPEAPTCEGGRNQLICVINALKEQDFDRVEPGRYTATTNQLSQPGQVIEINKQNAFLFIYPGANGQTGITLREADSAKLDPESLQITARTSKRLLNNGEEIHIFEHSNIILVLVGGTDAEIAQVQAAIDTLP